LTSQVNCDDSRENDCNIAVRREAPIQSHVAKLLAIPKSATVRKVHRVLVVDDSILPRAAARTMLSSAPNLRLVGEASSGAEALDIIGSLKPDLILMDVHMPDMDGPATARAVLSKNPEIKVVAWTVSESSDDLLRMMQVGCSGYVLKDAGPGELQRALLSALRSESPVPRKMIPEVLRRVAESTPLSKSNLVPLTSREMQILRGIAKGHTTKRMASDLGLAAPSIETHLHNIFRKLSATNRGEAVSTALKVGLLTLGDM
jgi:DNA-binding NarL/FixJ family response regulator